MGMQLATPLILADGNLANYIIFEGIILPTILRTPDNSGTGPATVLFSVFKDQATFQTGKYQPSTTLQLAIPGAGIIGTMLPATFNSLATWVYKEVDAGVFPTLVGAVNLNDEPLV